MCKCNPSPALQSTLFFSHFALRRRKTVLWLDDETHRNENIRKGIPGYMGFTDLPDGSISLQFDFRNIEPANQLDVHCFKTVESIRAFMMKPENLRFANFPPSMFRIISNRRLFIEDGGLCGFLDSPTTPWAFTYPSTMIFNGAVHDGVDVLDSRPNIVKSTLSRDCISFISFGFMLPSFSSPSERPNLAWLLPAATSSGALVADSTSSKRTPIRCTDCAGSAQQCLSCQLQSQHQQ